MTDLCVGTDPLIDRDLAKQTVVISFSQPLFAPNNILHKKNRVVRGQIFLSTTTYQVFNANLINTIGISSFHKTPIIAIGRPNYRAKSFFVKEKCPQICA
jgi:hypothetical protein